MELLGEPQNNTMDSPNSFSDSEFEERNLFPWTENGISNMRVNNQDQKEAVNNYGRPVARVPPTTRANHSDEGILPRPVPTYPPNYRPEETNFLAFQPDIPMEHEAQNGIASQQQVTQNTAQGLSLSPMLYPIPSGEESRGLQQFQMQSLTQVGLPFNMTHSSNLLLIPAQQRQSIRLLPTVMPNVARHCDICGKCYDQIALETLGENLVATEYEGETVKERAIRSRAFIHGFEAALFLFKNAGLSHPSRCDGSVAQL